MQPAKVLIPAPQPIIFLTGAVKMHDSVVFVLFCWSTETTRSNLFVEMELLSQPFSLVNATEYDRLIAEG